MMHREEEAESAFRTYSDEIQKLHEMEASPTPGAVRSAQAQKVVRAWQAFQSAMILLDAPTPEALEAERNRLAVEGVTLWCGLLAVGSMITLSAGTSWSLIVAAGIVIGAAGWTRGFIRRLVAHVRRRAGQ